MTQQLIDELFNAAIAGNKDALAQLRMLRDTGQIHVPAGSMRLVLGPAPAPAPVAAPVALPEGPARKKELTEAQRAEMLASEQRAKAEQLARQEAETAELRRVQAEREAQLAAVAQAPAPEPEAPKPAAPKGESARKKGRGEKTEAPKRQAPGPSMVRAPDPEPARAAAPKPPEPPAERTTPETPELDAQRAARQQGAKEAKARAAAQDLEGIPKPSITAQSTTEERIKVLQGRQFKKEWGKASEKAKQDILRNTFGERALQLPRVQQEKLGELALAYSGFKSSGLTSLPNMDDVQRNVTTIQDELKGGADLKTIGFKIENTHGRMMTVGGKIKSDLLKFRKPRAGQPGSDKPAPKPLEAAEASPGFETAKKAKVGPIPFDPENVPGATPAEPAAAEAPAPAPAPKAFDSEDVPGAVAGAATTAAEVGAEATAKEKSPYRKAVDADPAKYGTSASQTKEQKAARKKLADDLGLNSPEAKAAKAADREKWKKENPQKAETNRRWGEAVRSNPSKYGKSRRKRTAEQKKASDALYKKLEAEVAAEFAARGGAPAPAAPAKAAAAPAPAPTPAPAAPAPAKAAPAPAAAPAAAAPAAPAAAGGKGKRFTNKQIRQRAAQVYGKKGLAQVGRGAMSFLGPLLGAYTLYELASMAKAGTVDQADESRLKALQALGAVGGGMEQDIAQRAQIRGMQQMIDMAAMQRARSNDQMRRRYVEDDALNALLVGQQASLAGLAAPSRPSIAEMMARM